MIDDDRHPTAAEVRWFARLRRTLHDMPATVEVVVHAKGNVSLLCRGASAREFDLAGHTDNTPELSSFTAKNLRGEESSI